MGQTHTKCNDLLLPPLFGKRNLSAATGLFKCYRHCFPWKFLEQSLTLCRGLAALIFAAQGTAGIGLARRLHAKGTERPVDWAGNPRVPNSSPPREFTEGTKAKGGQAWAEPRRLSIRRPFGRRRLAGAGALPRGAAGASGPEEGPRRRKKSGPRRPARRTARPAYPSKAEPAPEEREEEEVEEEEEERSEPSPRTLRDRVPGGSGGGGGSAVAGE